MSKIKLPVVMINFKAYQEVDGTKAIDLARICEAVADESGVTVAICPPVTELGSVARCVGIPVFSQNVDPRTSGSATGWITPSMVASTGSAGSLINHSEHRFSDDIIHECVSLCRTNNLVSVVCAESVKKAITVSEFSPDFIAVEPPELIGGDVSVTTANPKIVSDTVTSVKSVDERISVLCGAGVKTGKDVFTALELGADGVLLASGVVKAKDQKAAILDLIKFI